VAGSFRHFSILRTNWHLLAVHDTLKKWWELLQDKFINANLAWPLKALIAIFIFISLWYMMSHVAIFLMQRTIEVTKHTLEIIKMLMIMFGFLIGLIFFLMAVRYILDSNRQCNYFMEELFTRCRPFDVRALVPPTEKKTPSTDKNKQDLKIPDKNPGKGKQNLDNPQSKNPEKSKESDKIKSNKGIEPKS